MNSWKRSQTVLTLTMAASLAAIVLGRLGVWTEGLLALIGAGSAWLLVRLERKIGRAQRDALLIRTLNHHRHDWMNDLQVLFGYIGLRKYDILHGYVDKIRTRVSNESALSKLGVPSLIVYLLTFRADKRAIALEIEMEREIELTGLPIDAEATADWFIRVVELFDRQAVELSDMPNVLNIQLDLEENSLFLDFVYNGGCRSDIKPQLEALLAKQPGGWETESDFSEHCATVTVRVPFAPQPKQD